MDRLNARANAIGRDNQTLYSKTALDLEGKFMSPVTSNGPVLTRGGDPDVQTRAFCVEWVAVLLDTLCCFCSLDGDNVGLFNQGHQPQRTRERRKTDYRRNLE